MIEHRSEPISWYLLLPQSPNRQRISDELLRKDNLGSNKKSCIKCDLTCSFGHYKTALETEIKLTVCSFMCTKQKLVDKHALKKSLILAVFFFSVFFLLLVCMREPLRD